MDQQETAEKAREALEILNKSGWCKGATTNLADPRYPRNSHCLGGAWNLALYENDIWKSNDITPYRVLASLILEQYPDRARAGEPAAYNVTEFNDHPHTTEDDVRSILEKLAAG